MLISRFSNAVEILAPAKVNLFLEVLGKRDDGYHAIDTIMCPISLCDRLIIERTHARGIDLEVLLPPEADANDPAWQIPSDENNLISRGLLRLQASLGTSYGCHVRVEKSIPAAAGLAGGSSDAAAAVTAGLLMWGGWNRELATSVCAALGSDIPFFLGSPDRIGMAQATGRGEQIKLIFAEPHLEFALTHPGEGCSTAEVYRRLIKSDSPKSSEAMISACETRDTEKIGNALFNALQFPAAELTDWIDRQLTLFRSAGLRYCSMTGSGSSCFALLERSEEELSRVAAAEQAAKSAGIPRFYRVQGHFCPSIERQI